MTIFCAKHALLKQCIAFFDRLSDIDVFCESVTTVSIEFAHQTIRQKVQKTIITTRIAGGLLLGYNPNYTCPGLKSFALHFVQVTIAM